MLLVRENCRLYNAPGSQVRHDCDVVFKFYLDESDKIAGSVTQVCQLSLAYALHAINITYHICLN